MDIGLKGKVALVTGCGSQIGFGKQIALLLAKEGCDAVAVTDIIDDVNKTAEDIKKLGKKSIAIKGDITKKADVQALIKKVKDEYGRIDILCNVAGGIANRQPFDQAGPEDWDKDFHLNVTSIMLTTQAVLPIMQKQKSGSIVNIGSGSTRMYGHGVGNTYAMSKAAVDTMTKQTAFNEAKNGIRCNCGCAELPGFYSLLSCYESAGMARLCPICQGQGRMAYRLFTSGKTLDEIRVAIDARYG